MSISDTPFDYDEYATARRELRELIQEDFAEAIAHVRKCDHLILASTKNIGSVEALSAAVHAHSLYLAACDLARSGHFSAMFPLFRTAMESAVYGYLFNAEEGLIEKWRNRHVSTECFNESKQAFTRAMTRFRTSIQKHDEQSGDHPYTELLMSLYDAAIDYGAHPNPIALTNNTSVVVEGDKTKFSYNYLRTDGVGIRQGFFACFDYGMAIAVINHFSRMKVDPSLPGLDATFEQFYRETNALSDKLNGEPIGFENRYYTRVNPFVPKSE